MNDVTTDYLKMKYYDHRYVILKMLTSRCMACALLNVRTLATLQLS